MPCEFQTRKTPFVASHPIFVLAQEALLPFGRGVALTAPHVKLAPDQGFAAVEFNYGVCLQNGTRTSIEFRRAAHYFRPFRLLHFELS
jgi:hypothetical protein